MIFSVFKNVSKNVWMYRMDLEGKKEMNNSIIRDRIIWDIRILFEQEKEDYYKPKRVSNFWNMKVMAMKIETYH